MLKTYCSSEGWIKIPLQWRENHVIDSRLKKDSRSTVLLGHCFLKYRRCVEENPLKKTKRYSLNRFVSRFHQQFQNHLVTWIHSEESIKRSTKFFVLNFLSTRAFYRRQSGWRNDETMIKWWGDEVQWQTTDNANVDIDILLIRNHQPHFLEHDF